MSRLSKDSLRGAPAGFTLVEVLLALTLSVALLAGLWTAISVHLKAFDAGRRGVEQAQLFRALTRRMQTDLASLSQPGIGGAVIAPPPVAVTSGDSAASNAAATNPAGAATANANPATSPKPMRQPGLRFGQSATAGAPATGSSPAGAPAASSAKPATDRGNAAAKPGAPGAAASASEKTSHSSSAPTPAVAPPLPVAAASAVQLAGGKHWLELTLSPGAAAGDDETELDDARRAQRHRYRVVKYYLAVPGDPWFEVPVEPTGALPRGVLVRREQLPAAQHRDSAPGAAPPPSDAAAPPGDAAALDPQQSSVELAGPPPPGSDLSAWPETVALLEIPEISTFAVRYFDGGGWHDGWHSREAGRMPLAVEVIWAMPRPLRANGARRGQPPTDDQRAAQEQLLAASDPFLLFHSDGPNLPPDLRAENSPWQVSRAVLALPQGQPAAVQSDAPGAASPGAQPPPPAAWPMPAGSETPSPERAAPQPGRLR